MAYIQANRFLKPQKSRSKELTNPFQFSKEYIYPLVYKYTNP